MTDTNDELRKSLDRALADVKAGRVTVYDNDDDFLAALDDQHGYRDPGDETA